MPIPTADDQDFPGLAELHEELRSGRLTSTQLTRVCLDRIAALNPVLHAVLALDDTALDQAAQADRRYADGAPLGPLDGIPVLVKDNIDTAGLASTAGSRLLAGQPPVRDAPVVARLRAAGCVLLGKTNLSEWSNFRSGASRDGWSAVGGQTRNPHATDRTPTGSSSGSAVAVATGMAPLTLGTETDGSVVAPAGVCGVVGLKTPLGLLPAEGVVPITPEQDTVGLFARRLSDIDVALPVLAGQEQTEQDRTEQDRTGIDGAPQDGRRAPRLGVWRLPEFSAELLAVLDGAVEDLERAGFQVVPVDLTLDPEQLDNELRSMLAEFRPALEAYLRTRPGAPQTLAELVAANRADPEELSLFGQELFEQALLVSDEDRLQAHAARLRVAAWARDLLGGALRRHGVDAVVSATNGPAQLIEGDAQEPGLTDTSSPAAVAGYPNISLPMGRIRDLPVGLSVFGPPDLDRLLPTARAIEDVLNALAPTSGRPARELSAER